MKFTLEQPQNLLLVQGYGPGYFRIGGTDYTQTVLLMPKQRPTLWSTGATLETWTDADLAPLLTSGCALVLIGSGKRWVMPPAPVLQACTAAGIGLEVMDSGAACRTYNLLVSEGRRVAALLWVLS